MATVGAIFTAFVDGLEGGDPSGAVPLWRQEGWRMVRAQPAVRDLA